jgi:hypothetical protein
MTTTPTIQSFTHTPTDVDLCRQIGRWWAQRTAASPAAADRLTYCEPDASTPANLYACPMPDRRFRKATGGGVSITPEPAAHDPAGIVRTIGIGFEARARTPARCIAMLRQIRAWMLPDERALVLPSAATIYLGQKVGRIIGAPADLSAFPPTTPGSGIAFGSSIDVWAIVGTAPLQHPTPVLSGAGGGGAGGSATAEGEALATMTLLVRAYPVRIFGPREAFTALYAPAGGLVELNRGTIEVTATHLIITSNAPIGTTTIALAGSTMGQVRTAIGAVAGWSTADGEQVDNNLSATRLLPMAETTAYDGAGDGPVSVLRLPSTVDQNVV